MPRGLKRVLAVLAVTLSAQSAGRSQTVRGGFEYFGAWEDVTVSKSEDPHADGYSLELWKDNGRLVGFLTEFVGPVADPPMGLLQEVTFDAASGRVSFSVKLSLGVTNLPGQKEFVPTRDLYVFAGTLGDQEVRGSLEQQDHLTNRAAIKRNVLWKRTKREDSFWAGKTVAEWQNFYAPILNARGPKW
jgi:hypothetical protein